MRLHVGADADDAQAAAIASAVAEHVGDAVEVFVGDADEPAATAYPPSHASDPATTPTGSDGETDQPLGPTDRKQRLREEIADIERGGPEKYRERPADQGKLFVCDRLDLWFGEDGLSFEDGRFAAFDSDERLPADGMVTGAAAFDGRDCHVMANDFSVKAGSMAEKGVEKLLRLQQRALKTGKPVLYLMDSSGGRIDQQTGFFANREGIGKYYYNHSRLSGRVPQICVLYGPCIAGAAYTPVFADFTIRVEGMSAMAIASLRMVKWSPARTAPSRIWAARRSTPGSPGAPTSSPATMNAPGSSSPT